MPSAEGRAPGGRRRDGPAVRRAACHSCTIKYRVTKPINYRGTAQSWEARSARIVGMSRTVEDWSDHTGTSARRGTAIRQGGSSIVAVLGNSHATTFLTRGAWTGAMPEASQVLTPTVYLPLS